jgi:sugar phosphate isomerase/epimerase
VRRLAGNDALGANPDTGNFLIVNQPSHEAIREVAKYAYMVHFKDFAPEPAGHNGFAYSTIDGRRLVGTAVGEGTVDLGACIGALKDSGFDGWLSVEYEGEEDPLTAVRRSIENARKYL